MLSASAPRQLSAANTNIDYGDTHYHVPVQTGSSDPLQNRATGMQIAAGADAVSARRRAKGLA
jgi:hypothetical protein